MNEAHLESKLPGESPRLQTEMVPTGSLAAGAPGLGTQLARDTQLSARGLQGWGEARGGARPLCTGPSPGRSHLGGRARVARRCAGGCLAGAACPQMTGGAPRSKQLAQGHKPSFPSPDEKLSILEERVGTSNCPRQSLQGDYIPAHLGGTAHPLSRIWFCAQPRDHALRRPGHGKPGMHLSDTRERKRAHSRLRPLVP